MEEGEEELLEVFGEVRVGDIMGAQVSGNWNFLDNLHGSIKSKLASQVEKSGSVENLVKTLSTSIVSFLLPEE